MQRISRIKGTFFSLQLGSMGPAVTCSSWTPCNSTHNSTVAKQTLHGMKSMPVWALLYSILGEPAAWFFLFFSSLILSSLCCFFFFLFLSSCLSLSLSLSLSYCLACSSYSSCLCSLLYFSLITWRNTSFSPLRKIYPCTMLQMEQGDLPPRP